MNNVTTSATCTSVSNYKCTHCGVEVSGGTWIQGVFYCPYCASVINANNSKVQYVTVPGKDTADFIKYINLGTTIPSCCINCSNHPSNGGSGLCNCTLPHFSGEGFRCSTNT